MESCEYLGVMNECYPGTSRPRPDELTRGGKGEYCCVPGCLNARYNERKEKTRIGLFTFPKHDPPLMKKWESVFKNIRRSG